MPVASQKMPADYFVSPHSFHYLEDFYGLDTTLWSTVAADSGASVAIDADGVGGRLLLTTGATNNNEAYAFSKEIFKFAEDKPLIIDARLMWAEANTDDANIMFGVMDGVAADALVDDGAGPKASFDGALFYKVDGGTRWQVISSNATARTVSDTELLSTQSGFQTLRIEFIPISTAEGQINFYIDQSGGQNLHTFKGYGDSARVPHLQHTIALSGLEEMALVFGVKAGAANSEVLTVDYTQWCGCR